MARNSTNDGGLGSLVRRLTSRISDPIKSAYYKTRLNAGLRYTLAGAGSLGIAACDEPNDSDYTPPPITTNDTGDMGADYNNDADAGYDTGRRDQGIDQDLSRIDSGRNDTDAGYDIGRQDQGIDQDLNRVDIRGSDADIGHDVDSGEIGIDTETDSSTDVDIEETFDVYATIRVINALNGGSLSGSRVVLNTEEVTGPIRPTGITAPGLYTVNLADCRPGDLVDVEIEADGFYLYSQAVPLEVLEGARLGHDGAVLQENELIVYMIPTSVSLDDIKELNQYTPESPYSQMGLRRPIEIDFRLEESSHPEQDEETLRNAIEHYNNTLGFTLFVRNDDLVPPGEISSETYLNLEGWLASYSDGGRAIPTNTFYANMSNGTQLYFELGGEFSAHVPAVYRTVVHEISHALGTRDPSWLVPLEGVVGPERRDVFAVAYNLRPESIEAVEEGRVVNLDNYTSE